MKTRGEMVACARRELAMRERVYPRWVSEGRMGAETAAHETECMRAILSVLEGLPDPAQPDLFRDSPRPPREN